jgi:hypothetical protein
MLYALAIVQLVLLVDPMIGHDANAVGSDVAGFEFGDVWTFVLLMSAFAGPAEFGFFDLFALVILLLILAPVVIAIGFSFWTGTRQPVARAVP